MSKVGKLSPGFPDRSHHLKELRKRVPRKYTLFLLFRIFWLLPLFFVVFFHPRTSTNKTSITVRGLQSLVCVNMNELHGMFRQKWINAPLRTRLQCTQLDKYSTRVLLLVFNHTDLFHQSLAAVVRLRPKIVNQKMLL